MKNQTILADYTALVDVTEDMRKLRVCPNYKAEKFEPDERFLRGASHVIIEGGLLVYCPTCKGTGLNPDMTAWWEALRETKLNYDYFKLGNLIVFVEAPIRLHDPDYSVDKESVDGSTFIHRPADDLRPWPEVLENLIFDQVVRCSRKDTGKRCPQMNNDYACLVCSMGVPRNLSGNVSFALATQETAPVFKRFGVETLVRA